MSAHPGISAAASYASEPMAAFITEHVAGRELNTWEHPIRTRQMLQDDASKRRHMKLTQVAGTYLLQRPGITVGGLAGNYTTLVSEQSQRATQVPSLVQAYLEASGVPHATRPTFEGVKVRIHVVGEQATAAVVRVPWSVIGDGTQTVRQLASAARQRLKACAVQRERLPKGTDTMLDAADVDGEIIPGEGEVVFLSSAETGRGAVTVDVYEQLPRELVELSLDAMWAFPALAATTVEVLTPSLTQPDGAVVLSVEPGADLTEYLFPAYGQYRRVGLPMLEHMYDLARKK
ncbi:hypothetical protein [Nesterenkonia sp. NBAIMH1]|uniref:hypothetical protein n=1 Tax=Nesterenkonia sp. NBAIMH1 TaxID=2600320 RepID=UPI0011B66169|nr:hypothetical protein [Nesterenkonia sp. NBAIMH1]